MQKNIKLYLTVEGEGQILLLNNIWKTTYFHERLVGLMTEKKLVKMDGLIINDCGSIHTFFMCMPIDAYFFDNNGVVIKIYKNIVPWKITFPIFRRVHVLETEINKINYPIKINQQLDFRCIS